MRSIRGEWSRKRRSTPTPWVMRRTTKLVRGPVVPLRAITTPSKTWMRSRVPSTTLTWTRTVSPLRRTGTSGFSCSRSSRSMMLMWGCLLAGTSGRGCPASRGGQWGRELGAGAPSPAQLLALLAVPSLDGGVVAAAQDFGYGPALEVGGPGVERWFEAVGLGEGLASQRLRGAKGTGEQPCSGLDDRHGRDLAPAEHVVADAQLLADLRSRALLDALVP